MRTCLLAMMAATSITAQAQTMTLIENSVVCDDYTVMAEVLRQNRAGNDRRAYAYAQSGQCVVIEFPLKVEVLDRRDGMVRIRAETGAVAVTREQMLR